MTSTGKTTWIDVRDYAPAGLSRAGVATTIDWTDSIQTAIDDAIARTYNASPTEAVATVYIPSGKYRITRPLRILRKIPRADPLSPPALPGNPQDLQFVGLRILGSALPYGARDGATVLDFATGTESSPGFVTQMARTVIFENLCITGRNQFGNEWNLKNASDNATYVVNSCRDTTFSPHCAIAVDPFTSIHGTSSAENYQDASLRILLHQPETRVKRNPCHQLLDRWLGSRYRLWSRWRRGYTEL